MEGIGFVIFDGVKIGGLIILDPPLVMGLDKIIMALDTPVIEAISAGWVEAVFDSIRIGVQAGDPAVHTLALEDNVEVPKG